MPAPKRKKRKLDKRNRFAFLNDIDLRDTRTIATLGIRSVRKLLALHQVKIPRTCIKKDEILYVLHTHLEKVYGKDYALTYGQKPDVASDKVDAINKAVKRNAEISKLDWTQCEALCRMLCSTTEIRGFFRMSSETLNEHCLAEFGITFADYHELHSANGRISIRRAQMKLVLREDAPSVPMLIHLGKAVLGQTDSGRPTGKAPPPPDGVLTTETLVSYLSENNLLNKDVLRDTVTLDAAFRDALAQNTDPQIKASDSPGQPPADGGPSGTSPTSQTPAVGGVQS